MAEEFDIQFVDISKAELERWNQADLVAQQDYIDTMEAKGLPGAEVLKYYHELEEKYSAKEYALGWEAPTLK